MRIRIGLHVIVFTIILGAMPVRAQQKGQYIPGQQGLNSGVLPDPGFTYANITINYYADTLRNGSGGSIPLSTAYNIWAVENIFFLVPGGKLLGAKVAPYIVAPTPANGSLTLSDLNFPNVTVQGGGEGLADIWFQPINLGWSFKRADINAGYAFVAPTGRYTPGATNNVGSGYWGNDLTSGNTFYLTKNKGTSANLFADYEFNHGNRATALGTTLTPGQTFTIEWALGQVLPLKKDFSLLGQLGVNGYDQWQVTNNKGLLAPNVPASAVPYYSVDSIGVQANLIAPKKALNLFFRFEDEYRAIARPQGRTIAFGGSWTLRFPKPQPPPAKP